MRSLVHVASRGLSTFGKRKERQGGGGIAIPFLFSIRRNRPLSLLSSFSRSERREIELERTRDEPSRPEEAEGYAKNADRLVPRYT